MDTQIQRACAWHCLPTEMKIAVIDLLNVDDAKAFSRTNKEVYVLCIPVTFKHVKLSSFGIMQDFLAHVPKYYCHYIRQLDTCTMMSQPISITSPHPRTDAIVSLLNSCTRLENLSLRLCGGLAGHVIPCFRRLEHLKELSLSNCGQEPLSERLVVSIAASVPGLEQLTLDHISRSTMHAPELVGTYPYIPLVTGDDDIDDHPLLGSELSLPSLLRISSLRKLIIQDTHLGDPRWVSIPAACRLEVLELGSCAHETDDVNSTFIERIMSTIGPTVDEASLSTAIADETFAEPSATPLKRLRKLHISPFFPVDSVVETMANLSGSPIETISVRCFEDDMVDICTAVEDFLSLRVERGFYRNLTKIDVSVATNDLSWRKSDDCQERANAARHLQEFCNDLRIEGNIHDALAKDVGVAKLYSHISNCQKTAGRVECC